MPIESWYPKHIARDAIEWTGNYKDLPAVWRRLDALEALEDGALQVRTNHGLARAEKGDYVVRDLAGTFYPVKRAIFFATYEKGE